MATKVVVYVMGPSGCGKSTVGAKLAESRGVPFLDADTLHSTIAIAKMAASLPLTDLDRLPWLEIVKSTALAQAQPSNDPSNRRRMIIVACSALNRLYRGVLRNGNQENGVVSLFICLDGSRSLLLNRLKARRNHFMPETLLDSQLATLEIPDEMGTAVVTLGTGVDLAEERGIEAVVDDARESMRKLLS